MYIKSYILGQKNIYIYVYYYIKKNIYYTYVSTLTILNRLALRLFN